MSDPRVIRRELRGAVLTGDDATLLTILRERPWPENALQLIGDGLGGAVARKADGADQPARDCVSALRERGWRGDEELADALESRLGNGPAPLLRPLPVDLEELAMALEGDPMQGNGAIDLTTGAVWQGIDVFVEPEEDMDFDDPDRWLLVHCEGSRAGYRDMTSFIADVEDPDVADRLSIAIEGRGAFRRFKGQLNRWPDLESTWYAYADERQRGRAREWLAGEGYCPVWGPVALSSGQ